MAVVDTAQRMPITTAETGDEDALSVRHGFDLTRNVNNFARYIANPMLILNNIWDNGTTRQIQSSPIVNEAYMAKWPLLPLPRDFGRIRFVLRAAITAGVGTVTLYLTSDMTPYQGPTSAPSLAGSFTTHARRGVVVVAGGAWAYYTGDITGIAVGGRTFVDHIGPCVSLTLSGLASDGATRAAVDVIAAWGTRV